MKTGRSICVLAILCGLTAAADQTKPENYNISSSQTLTVLSGNVDTYTGLFTGTKNLYLSAGEGEGAAVRGGTAVLTNPENTFSGTFYLGYTSGTNPNGVFRFDSAGASGTARCYTNGGSNKNAIRQFQFNAEGATFHNNLEMGQASGGSGFEYAPFKFMKSCTLAGTIVSALSGGKRTEKTITIIDDPNERPTVSFLGNVEVGKYFSPVPTGTFKMYGALTVPILLVDVTNALGTVELYNSSNAITHVNLGYTNLKLMAPDVLTNSVIQLSTTRNMTPEGVADLYLYADQHIKAFSRTTSWYQTGAAAVVRAGGTASPTLAFDGHAENSEANRCRFAFDGPLSLVKTGVGIQDFDYRTSTMTGEITVSNGTLRISSVAKFPNVSAVNVEGGLLDLGDSSTTGCFADAQRLSVADNAQFLIGASVKTPFTNLQSVVIGSTGKIESTGAVSLTIETENLEIGGETLFKGLYTSATHPANIGEGITIKCNNKGGLILIYR